MLKNRSEKHIIVFSHYQFIAAFDWLKGTATITRELMADFRQYLFSYQMANTGVCEIKD
jgi:hypothetical protein